MQFPSDFDFTPRSFPFNNRKVQTVERFTCALLIIVQHQFELSELLGELENPVNLNIKSTHVVTAWTGSMKGMDTAVMQFRTREEIVSAIDCIHPQMVLYVGVAFGSNPLVGNLGDVVLPLTVRLGVTEGDDIEVPRGLHNKIHLAKYGFNLSGPDGKFNLTQVHCGSLVAGYRHLEDDAIHFSQSNSLVIRDSMVNNLQMHCSPTAR